MSTPVRRVFVALFLILSVSAASRAQAPEEDQLILGGMSWMTQFPSTWNAGASKVVSDGLHYYAVICGYYGSSSNCSIARRRGLEEWQAFGHWLFTSSQPATLIIDRKGRLNIFFNDPYIHHFRFDHPSVNLVDWVSVTIPFAQPAAYIQASYSAVDDIITIAFNETANYGLKFAVKYTDANDWLVTSLPDASPGTMLLYARTLRTPNRYLVLAGEHVRTGINASYTAAVLFESPTSTGPWTRHVLHQVYGSNMGVPYENWVLANDLQADGSGRARALLHITENGSGHADPLDGFYILREEDGYLPRLIGRGIEDGFVLNVDPTGIHLALARAQVPHRYPGNTQGPPDYYTGDIVSFISTDNGATWGMQVSEVESAVNPTTVDTRNGSMLGGRFLALIYTDEVTDTGPWDEVWFLGVSNGLDQLPLRYDYAYTESDGTVSYIRAYQEAQTGRYYYYLYDYRPDGSFAITSSYSAGTYCQAYVADSNGSYRYYNSDGFQITVGTTAVITNPTNDGVHNIHLRGMCGGPARVSNLRIVPGAD